jgi:hypothetical protein
MSFIDSLDPCWNVNTYRLQKEHSKSISTGYSNLNLLRWGNFRTSSSQAGVIAASLSSITTGAIVCVVWSTCTDLYDGNTHTLSSLILTWALSEDSYPALCKPQAHFHLHCHHMTAPSAIRWVVLWEPVLFCISNLPRMLGCSFLSIYKMRSHVPTLEDIFCNKLCDVDSLNRKGIRFLRHRATGLEAPPPVWQSVRKTYLHKCSV